MKNSAKWKKMDTILILALAGMIFLCIIIISSVAYFSNQKTVSGTITLGELDFSIGESEITDVLVVPSSTTQHSVFVGNFRYNDEKDFKNLCGIYFRYSWQILVDKVYDEHLTKLVKVLTSDDYLSDGNWVYFCKTLSRGEKTDICSGFQFVEEIGNEYQNKSVEVVFMIDAVQADNIAYKEVWNDYSSQWETVMFG